MSASDRMIITYPIDCENCGVEYSIKCVIDEDTGEQTPIFCAFCGNEIILIEEYDDDEDYDEDYD